MAYPVLVAVGAAAAAAGAGLQIAGAEESTNAMNQALAENIAEQGQYQKQATGVFQQSLEQSSPASAQADMAKGVANAEAQYQQLESAPESETSTAAQTGSSGQPSSALVRGKTQQSNTSQAALQGYTEWDLQQQIKDLQANQNLGIIGFNSRNLANILPYQVQQASQAGAELTGIGGLVGAAGGVLGTYGATRPQAPSIASAGIQTFYPSSPEISPYQDYGAAVG